MMKTISLNALSVGKLKSLVQDKEQRKMTNEDLFIQIENLRLKMITVGLSKGFTSVETVKLSERLDRLINLQMGLVGKISA